MKAALLALLALLLCGCATAPETAQFRFVCIEGVLVAAATIGEDGYLAPVGHCIGNMQIIGPRDRVTAI